MIRIYSDDEQRDAISIGVNDQASSERSHGSGAGHHQNVAATISALRPHWQAAAQANGESST
jgi:hypothetical protein